MKCYYAVIWSQVIEVLSAPTFPSIYHPRNPSVSTKGQCEAKAGNLWCYQTCIFHPPQESLFLSEMHYLGSPPGQGSSYATRSGDNTEPFIAVGLVLLWEDILILLSFMAPVGTVSPAVAAVLQRQ